MIIQMSTVSAQTDIILRKKINWAFCLFIIPRSHPLALRKYRQIIHKLKGQSALQWIRRFILFHRKPAAVTEVESERQIQSALISDFFNPMEAAFNHLQILVSRVVSTNHAV
jgi:hypothetical protein